MEVPSDWTFKNADVAAAFNRHVREQLPWYDLATGAVAHIARHYLPEQGLMYDIGASTGNIGIAMQDILTKRNATYVPIDNSEQMAEVYHGPGQLVVADAIDYDYEQYDVAVCFLVLMFIPPAKRKAFVHRLIGKIRQGGALIIFDKTEAATGYLSTILHRLTIAGKVSTGVPAQEIVEKELSLSGVQRPLPHHFMQWVAPSCTEVFRFGEFAGWVIAGPE
jgi:tRNA (cmo5U34)-methyltransferase